MRLRFPQNCNVNDLLQFTEASRIEAMTALQRTERQALGQFLTPAPVAALMASLLDDLPTKVRLLDAGAGVGSLSAALVTDLCNWEHLPEQVSLCAYEIDARLQPALQATLERCEDALTARGVRASKELHVEDFIEHAVAQLQRTTPPQGFNCALVNPPYRKIRRNSRESDLLRQVGIDATNLYSAFLALIVKLLEPGGTLCAICPRSFCNGPYFLPFRTLLIDTERMSLQRIHEFTTRNQAFADDAVLQETVIFTAVKRASRSRSVLLTQSAGPPVLGALHPDKPRAVAHDAILQPGDTERIIHIPWTSAPLGGLEASNINAKLTRTLDDLGVCVSTGRVVDFRATRALRERESPKTVPLLYPAHLQNGRVQWPLAEFRKRQHIASDKNTEKLLLPLGPKDRYILVKRFSPKEQLRRIVAVQCETRDLSRTNWIGVENHINVLSGTEDSLKPSFARGLCAFLNSTLLDEAFRQFSGNTQVNASDLRRLRFPNRACLESLGKSANDATFEDGNQDALDNLVMAALSKTGNGN